MLVILGGNGGVGKGLADFAQESGLAERLGGLTVSMRADCDLRREVSVDGFFRGLRGRGPLYVVNATGSLLDGRIRGLDVSEVLDTLNNNLGGALRVMKAFRDSAPADSSLLMLSSVLVSKPRIGTGAYVACKAALEGFVRVGALEFAEKNLRVNAVRMGYFNVGMLERVPADTQMAIRSFTPLKGFGDVPDLGILIEGVLRSPFMTGSIVDLHGGIA